MILSANQQKILDALIPVAKIATQNPCAKLPLQPRTHTLICAPSGSGKSHLMRHLGNALEVPVLLLNVSSWQVLGSKEHTNTWDTIVGFLKENERGIIVLDELDKLDQDSAWLSYIRLEIHDLLDGVIPPALDIDDLITDLDGW